MLSRSDNTTLSVALRRRRPRQSRAVSVATWIAMLLLVVPVTVVGVFRFREAWAARTPREAPVVIAPPRLAPDAELPSIAPRPAAETEAAPEPAQAKKKRRPKEDNARRALERLQRAQLERAGTHPR